MKPIAEIILILKNAIAGIELISVQDDMTDYGSDYTEDLYFPPAIVCFPKSTEEIAALMKICNEIRSEEHTSELQ